MSAYGTTQRIVSADLPVRWSACALATVRAYKAGLKDELITFTALLYLLPSFLPEDPISLFIFPVKQFIQ